MNLVDVGADLYLLLAALGLCLSVQYAELPILGQSAFVAVGGFGTLLLAQHGVPLGIAVLLAVLIAAVIGFLLAAGTATLTGAPLALATWAVAWLAQAVLTGFSAVSGGSDGLVRATPTRLVSPALGVAVTITPTGHVVIAASLVVLTVVALRFVDQGPLGLDVAAMRAGAPLATSLGVPVAARRRHVLTATAALGALGGSGAALLLGTVAPADVSPLLSLQLLAAVLLGGSWRPYGVIPGFAFVAALPHVADAIANALTVPAEQARAALTAVLLVGALLVRARLPVGGVRRMRGPARSGRPGPVDEGGLLAAARGVRVSYGVLQALDGVDLELHAGQVHAVIGPNGSGKSTLLRVLAGAQRPDAGTVTIQGSQPKNQAAAVRAGIARTPQRTVLFDRMSPLVQAAVGAHAAHRVSFGTVRHLLVTPSARRRQAAIARQGRDALDAVGLVPLAGVDPATLTTRQQRLLQVARIAATGADVLLLDEPSAGVGVGDKQLGEVIRDLARNGAAVCVVEHDMRLVAAVADRVTVLDAGRVLATGPPESVRQDPAVRRAYLGDDVAEPA